MLKSRELCPMRHENGNCLPCGGFCMAVNPLICETVQNAYDIGMREGITATMRAKSMVVQKRGRWEWRGGIPWCTNCNEIFPGFSYEESISVTDYCPNCGAKMDGET